MILINPSNKELDIEVSTVEGLLELILSWDFLLFLFVFSFMLFMLLWFFSKICFKEPRNFGFDVSCLFMILILLIFLFWILFSHVKILKLL